MRDHDLGAALAPVVDRHLGDTFPALALAVIHGDALVFEHSWGWVDPETKQEPVRVDTLFDLASVTKLFTTTAFLSLVSDGHVTLDTPLVEIVPEFGASGPRPLDGGQDPHSKAMLPVPEHARGLLADPARVTFRHLLTHTSGLAPWRDVYQAAGPAPLPPDKQDPLPRRLRLANGFAAIYRYPFVGLPGDGVVRYSDLGLMLLGEAASRLHGTPGELEPVVHSRVLIPLGLWSITYNPLQHGMRYEQEAPTENDPKWRGRRCWGEVHDENASGLGGVAGHAGLFGTALGVAQLGQAWLHKDARLGISPALMDEAVQEQARTGPTRRGLGWLLYESQDSSAGSRFSARAFGHTGFTGTSLWIDPERDLVVATMTNRVYPGREKVGIHAFRRTLHDAIVEALEA